MKHKKRKAPAIVAFGNKLSSVETETRYQNPKAKIFDLHFPICCCIIAGGERAKRENKYKRENKKLHCFFLQREMMKGKVKSSKLKLGVPTLFILCALFFFVGFFVSPLLFQVSKLLLFLVLSLSLFELITH